MLLYTSCGQYSPWQYYVEIVISGLNAVYRLVRMYLALGQKFVYDLISAAVLLNVRICRLLRHSETRSECADVVAHRDRAALLAITIHQESVHKLERDSCLYLCPEVLVCRPDFVIFRMDENISYATAAVYTGETGKTGEVSSSTSDRMHPRVSTQSDARLAWLHLGSEGAASLRYDESGSSVRVQHYHRIEI